MLCTPCSQNFGAEKTRRHLSACIFLRVRSVQPWLLGMASRSYSTMYCVVDMGCWALLAGEVLWLGSVETLHTVYVNALFTPCQGNRQGSRRSHSLYWVVQMHLQITCQKRETPNLNMPCRRVLTGRNWNNAFLCDSLEWRLLDVKANPWCS